MKKFLKIVAIIIVIIAAGSIYVNYKMSSVEKESSDIATNAVTAISTSWNPEELQTRAHPSLIQEAQEPGQRFEDVFKIYQKLGKLKDSPECQFQRFHSNIDTTGNYTLADYLCKADYENGTATISMQLRQESNHTTWLIYGFRIDSPLFTKLLEK